MDASRLLNPAESFTEAVRFLANEFHQHQQCCTDHPRTFIVGLAGAPGSGKTTLARALASSLSTATESETVSFLRKGVT
ncbi:Hypothetical protein, putative [Bodo saltans]|uniref:Zeta toxin domain-containing protein n=1 Tax=Bodo saltans TaxID=75058 RepID=A0A0S4JMS4_BODSA|nr:Hypothetical protein, putative [Bodo saltans]|eukprot:CUG91523.1 Hypothetical protein, putative [Bodo saltans]